MKSSNGADGDDNIWVCGGLQLGVVAVHGLA
jgi:hypothetical protein